MSALQCWLALCDLRSIEPQGIFATSARNVRLFYIHDGPTILYEPLLSLADAHSAHISRTTTEIGGSEERERPDSAGSHHGLGVGGIGRRQRC